MSSPGKVTAIKRDSFSAGLTYLESIELRRSFNLTKSFSTVVEQLANKCISISARQVAAQTATAPASLPASVPARVGHLLDPALPGRFGVY